MKQQARMSCSYLEFFYVLGDKLFSKNVRKRGLQARRRIYMELKMKNKLTAAIL